MSDEINKAPINYEDWIDLGRVIIPCDTKQAVVEKWSDPDFKITKEEWRIEHATKQIGLRLDHVVLYLVEEIIHQVIIFGLVHQTIKNLHYQKN